MGFFGKLFGGGGARKPPSWASVFGDDGARFDRFATVVARVLREEGFPLDGGDVRSGSVMIEDDRGGTREWIFHQAAARCAAADEGTWHAIVRADFRGAPAPVAAAKAWVMGTSAWGGVLLECGAQQMLMVLLPIRDRGPLAALPQFPSGLIREIIVCNASGEGVLDVPAVARAARLDHVYALDPAKPVGGDLRVEPVPAAFRRGPLALAAERGSVLATWDNGVTAAIGDAMPFTWLCERRPRYLFGMIAIDGTDHPNVVDFMLRPPEITLIANVPGLDARRLATALSQMGLGSKVINLDQVPAEEPAEPRRLRVLAHMTHGELDQADALAAEAIAAGEDVEDLTYQRAMIALMRGDEDAALAHLAQVATPQAHNSRAAILARRKDPRAIDEARAALAALPGDAIAIRGAVIVHALLGDRDGARALLDAHGAALDGETKVALDRTIDDPPAMRGHRFPEHAKLVFDAVKPMIDDGRLADAAPLLRRAAGWDPENVELVCDLGYVLGKLGQDADAIAIYDDAIARGGSRVLLRFNRGNCKLRLKRYADAADDFRACLALKPDWHDVRVNLTSALFAAGDPRAARAQIDELRAQGGPAQHIRSLEQMLAGTL